MKNSKYKILAWAFILAMVVACQPMEEDKPEAGQVLPPDAGALDFSITPAADGFRYALQFTQPEIKGIYQVTWDMGNGSVVSGEKANAYYPLPDTYTVKMTVKTNMGSTSKEKTITTTKTDYSIFTDPRIVALTGGIDALNGKTWMVDAASKGHFGVGDATKPHLNGLDWWSADPFTKSGTGAYDDELNFKLDGFKVTYENHGVSYVKGYTKDDPARASIYLNARLNKDDYDVDYLTPVSGTWIVEEKNNGYYLKINSSKPIFPGLDVGAKDNEYQVLHASENLLELVCFSSYENWTLWHFLLIPKGYVKPMVTLDAALSPGTGVNNYKVTISNVVIPTGESITGMKADFGDGTIVESDDYVQTATHTYMRKGNYVVTLTVMASSGNITKTFPVSIAANHPDYVPFLLDMMVVYNDFSEVAMAPVLGQDCNVSVVDNPGKVYPNKSTKVASYSKTNNEWANAYLQLPAGYRFDLRNQQVFKIMVYGKAGDVVLMKLENTDRGGNAWQTGTYDLKYTIKKENTWEVAEFDFNGIGAGFDWTGDQFTSNIIADNRFNHDFYNVVRIMLNPGVATGTHAFYFDELAGPHVEGLKSATRK